MLEYTPSVSIPLGWLSSIWLRLMPAIVEFGSPANRCGANYEHQAHWHIPITLLRRMTRPRIVTGCKVFADIYENDQKSQSIPLVWGDMMFFDKPAPQATLRWHEVEMVPIAWRSEQGGDANGYFTDATFFKDQRELNHSISCDRAWYRFKLRVQSGRFKSESPHFYRVHCPRARSNGQFTVEIEYEGEGTGSNRLSKSTAINEVGEDSAAVQKLTADQHQFRVALKTFALSSVSEIFTGISRVFGEILAREREANAGTPSSMALHLFIHFSTVQNSSTYPKVMALAEVGIEEMDVDKLQGELSNVFNDYAWYQKAIANLNNIVKMDIASLDSGRRWLAADERCYARLRDLKVWAEAHIVRGIGEDQLATVGRLWATPVRVNC